MWVTGKGSVGTSLTKYKVTGSTAVKSTESFEDKLVGQIWNDLRVMYHCQMLTFSIDALWIGNSVWSDFSKAPPSGILS